MDANISLTLILLLMISLISMNMGYVGYKTAAGEEIAGDLSFQDTVYG